MTGIPKPLIAAGAAVAMYVTALGLANTEAVLLALKPLPVLCFAIFAASTRGPYARLITAGLLVSMIADVVIEGSFLAGLVLFLVAHFIYVAAFSTDRPPLRLLRALPIALVFGAIFTAIASGLGPLRLPVFAYVLTIGAMVWRAAARVGRTGAWTRPELWAFGGAICFAGSDTVLALDRFRATIPFSAYPVMLLYWMGQFGIARSTRDQFRI